MIPNPDIDSRIDEIRNLVAANELNTATRRAMDLANDFAQRRATKNHSIAIRSAFTEIRETELTDPAGAKTARVKLRQQILEFSDLIAEEFVAATREQLGSDRPDIPPQSPHTSRAIPSPEPS